MTEKLFVKIIDRFELSRYITQRDGETKAGQAIQCMSSKVPEQLSESLRMAHEAGVRYGLVLVPEDIGPRANAGRGGASEAPEAFLNYFMNMQSNRFFNYSRVALVGEVEVSDLMQRSLSREGDLEALRLLVQDLDQRVAAIVELVTRAGIEPIVIGGGNNNSLGTIRGVVNAHRAIGSQKDFAIAVSNCDPHADFRRMEGHHSGNPFSYAFAQGLLKRYCILGLHENYNSEEMLGRLDTSGCRYFSYESFAIRKEVSFEDCVEQAYDYLRQSGLQVGCELDLDSIKMMPSSAKTPFGITQEQAAHYIHSLASRMDILYLHLSECAPKLGGEDGARDVGKSLALLVVTYVKAREQFRAMHGTHGGLKRFSVQP